MSSLTGKSLNPVMNRRSVIASAAGLGAMSILAGCSSNGGDSGSASGDASFKIGTIGPLTGANASYGKSVTQGVELGCKDFSTKELPLVSKAEDDQADGEKAVNAFNTLLDWGMQALVGPTTTGASVAVAAECGNDPETFMITPSASSEDVTKGKDCVFQVCFTDPNQGVNAAKFLAQKYANEKFVLFYNSGDAYSSGIADSFKAQAAKSKLEIVDEETFKDDSATSFTNQLTKAKQALTQAQAGVAQAEAQQSASLAQIQASMDQINKQASLGTVTAPCSGTVTAVNVDRGGMASSAQPSVVIAENGAVEVQVSVAEDVFTGIKVGDTASVTVSAVSKESMNGTVSTLPAAANAQTNLYDVSVSLPSGTKPPIGAFATVTFYTDRRASTISVPTESILTGNNNEQYVFTVNADGTAATRVTVTTGLVTKDSTEIVSGLKAGDRVVTKGQSYLSDGAAVHVVTSDAADGGEG